MTKLISGRVAKVPSANVSADRYEFIDLSETEPDLGLPTQSGWVLSSDVTGNRAWVDPVQAAGGIPFFANTSLVANVSFQANVANTVNRIDNFTTTNLREGSNLYYTDARVLANVSQMSVNVLADVDITGIVPNGILTWDGTKFIAGTITTGAVANTALFSYVANVANTVLTLGNFTTSNLREGSNLYYTNARVNAFIQPFLTTANVLEISGNLYFTNTRVVSALIAGQNITIEANGRISANSDSALSATNTNALPEGTNNLYYTNSRVISAVTPLLTAANITNFNSTVNAIIYPSLTTANVIESSSYLYFTNARVASNVVALFTPNGNVSAYASKYIVEYNPSTKVISYSSTPDASNPYISGYSSEIHVSPVAFNDSGNGTIGDPVKTIARAQALAALAFETTGAGQRKSIILHPGDYTENVTISTQYTVLTTHELIGKNTTLSGTLTITKGCTIDGLKMTNLVISAASADGSVDIIGCTVTGTATKTSTAYTNFRGCDLSTSTLSITGAGTVVLSGGNYYTLTVNNASAAVLAKAVISMGPITLTAGTLQLSDTLVYSATNTANAITQSAGSVLTLNNSQTLIPDLTNVSRNSFGGYYSILSSVYDKTNSTFGGVSLNSVVYDQYINADRLILNGSTSGSTILNATGVAGSTTLTLPAATDTLVGKATTDTLTNKTLSNAVLTGTLTAGGGVGSTGQVLTSTVTGVQWTTTSTTADQANTVLTLSNFTTANLTEASSNQYFTNVRVLQAVNPVLTTANVLETNTNLYYTNSRVRSTLSGSTGVVYDDAAGTISIGQNVATTASVTFYNVSVTNNLTVYGGVETFAANNMVVSDNMIYLNNGSISSNPDLGIAFNYNDGVYHHAGFFRDHSDGVFKVFDNYSPEPDANIFINTAHASFRIANIQATTLIGNITGTAGTLDNFTTTNLKEGSNLYYTNARARTAFTAGDSTIIIDWTAGTIKANVAAATANSLSLTTADVREVASNLYFTVGRVNATVQPFLTTANVVETSGNLYFTNARANATIWPSLTAANIANFTSTVNATIWPSLTTANVTESLSNLYFTAARANAAIYPSLTAANIANFVSTVNATVQPFLTTANVVETSGNLYYTNARARTAFTAGNGIIVDWATGTISSNISPTTANSLGLTTADVREVSSNLYFSNARAIASFGAGNGIEISQNGIISARGLVPLYTIQTAGVFGNISSTMSNIITFPTSTSTDRFMVRSIHVVNMSGGTALVSGNILYSTGNTVPFANQIPVSQGGVLEFFKRSSSYQLFQPGDTINLQGFNAAGTATANLMCVSLAYDTFQNDETYIGTGKVLSNVDSTIQVYDSGQAYSVIESIKFVNLQSAYAPVKAWYADANGIPKAFFVYNLSIPPNSTVEILQSIKRIEQYDKIYASYSNAPNAAVSVFVSARVGSVTGLYTYTPTAVPGNAAEVVFTATDPEGTTFYYTIE